MTSTRTQPSNDLRPTNGPPIRVKVRSAQPIRRQAGEKLNQWVMILKYTLQGPCWVEVCGVQLENVGLKQLEINLSFKPNLKHSVLVPGWYQIWSQSRCDRFKQAAGLTKVIVGKYTTLNL